MTMSNEKHLNDFDPKSTEFCAAEWLEAVQQFAITSGLSEDQLYCYVRGKLRGSARYWLKRSNVTGWQEFQHAFLNAFSKIDSSEIARKAHVRLLERRKKKSNESFLDYIEEMLRIGSIMKLSEEVIVSYIVAGFEDPILSKAIPLGASLNQIRNAVQWQAELNVLMYQYNDSKVTLDDFERLADSMEEIVLDGDGLTESLHGNQPVLQTIRKELSSIMRRHRVALSYNLSDLGTSKTHQIVVHLKPKNGSRELDTGKQPEVHVTTRRLLQTSLISHLSCDVIQKSSSPPSICHPMHVFDAQSIVLDLSHLNGMVHREPPNFLHPEPLLSALAAFRYFTTLDFNAGHLQIPVVPDSRRYFSFGTPLGTFQLQRAPKHFTNTTIIFNKILIELARKLPPGDVVVLNDTLILPSRDAEHEGLAQLSRVLAALAAFGLTTIVHRCQFFEPQIQLHNWIVQQGKVSSIGLPFQLPVNRGHRLVLVISESSVGKTFESLLRKENGTSEVFGRYSEERREDDEDADKRVRLAKHVADSIEHFRQFILFASFEVLLEVNFKVMDTYKTHLLEVQQFDFEVNVKNINIF